MQPPAITRVLYANRLAKALFSELFRDAMRPANHAHFVFLDPLARTFWVDWEKVADDTVGVLRGEVGRNSHDPARRT